MARLPPACERSWAAHGGPQDFLASVAKSAKTSMRSVKEKEIGDQGRPECYHVWAEVLEGAGGRVGLFICTEGRDLPYSLWLERTASYRTGLDPSFQLHRISRTLFLFTTLAALPVSSPQDLFSVLSQNLGRDIELDWLSTGRLAGA